MRIGLAAHFSRRPTRDVKTRDSHGLAFGHRASGVPVLQVGRCPWLRRPQRMGPRTRCADRDCCPGRARSDGTVCSVVPEFRRDGHGWLRCQHPCPWLT